jgi:YbbR domain-containing protein
VALKFESVKRTATNNWELKLLALLLAVLTYYAIRGATGVEREYPVPVQVEVDPGIAVLAQEPDTIEVGFRGSQGDMLDLDPMLLRAIVHPKSREPDGTAQVVPVSPRDIEGAPGVAVVSIEPNELVVTFDREVEIPFRVAKPEVVGKPLIGRVELDYEPDTVVVRGPKRLLEELKRGGGAELSTEPVDVDGRVESYSKLVKIRPPSGPWVSGMEPDEVTVNVRIIKETARREWEGIKVLAVHDSGTAVDVFFDPPEVSVSIEGRTEVVEGFSEEDIRVFVVCSGLDPEESHKVPVQVHLPVYRDIDAHAEPKVVTVSFSDPVETETREPEVE